MAEAEIHIHHAYIPGRRLPNSSTLSIAPGLISLEVTKNPLTCLLRGFPSHTHAWVNWKTEVRTATFTDPTAIPESLVEHAPYLRKELAALLAKFWQPTTSIFFNERHSTPTLRQRKQLLNPNNCLGLVQLCRLIELPLKQLPTPIYQACLLQSL